MCECVCACVYVCVSERMHASVCLVWYLFYFHIIFIIFLQNKDDSDSSVTSLYLEVSATYTVHDLTNHNQFTKFTI